MVPTARRLGSTGATAIAVVLAVLAALAAPRPGRADPAACRLRPAKAVSPGRVVLGQTVSVTLRLAGACDGQRRARSDIMLVVDQSGSMAGDKLAAAQAAAHAFVDGIDFAFDQVGVVGFASEATLLAGLTTDRARLAAAIGALVPDGGTNIAAGVDEARHVYKNPGHRPDATRVIVVMTDGANNAGPAVAISAARYAKAEGARVFAIGFGADADMLTLTRMASNGGDAFAAPSAADLSRIYAAIADRVSGDVAFTRLVVTDTLAADMRYADASGRPWPDRSGLTMVWDLSFVGPAGADIRFAVEPQTTGRLPISDRAVARGVGPDGSAVAVDFPAAFVDVVAPPAPTATPGPACVCGVVRRRVPPAVIAHAVANPERYLGWQAPLDPGKPPGPNNPPRACLALQNGAIDYHPQFNTPIWRVGCP
ncbi:hypothetical protein DCC79_01890 [bacterium]|nr:MAG: hypothetical protein DCC79_01890 [bacterium]